MKKKITDELHDSFRGISEYMTFKIWKKINSSKDSQKISTFRFIDKEDLKSIVYQEIYYLAWKYKDGEMSLTTYILEYLEKRVWNNLFKNYNFPNETKYIEDMMKDDDSQMDYMERRSYGEYEFETMKDIGKEIEDRDLISTFFNNADEINRQIFEQYYNGYSLGEIAKGLGMTKQAVDKRIKKYGK